MTQSDINMQYVRDYPYPSLPLFGSGSGSSAETTSRQSPPWPRRAPATLQPASEGRGGLWCLYGLPDRPGQDQDAEPTLVKAFLSANG